MEAKRRKINPTFNANVAVEAIRERHTLAELGEKFEVNLVMISRWKKEFLENSSKAFGEIKKPKEEEVDTEKLYGQIGQLKVENDSLIKSCKRTGLTWKGEN